jgi:uncharacterized protein (TIGR00255 family)
MPYSMTGFSSATAESGPFSLVWELRSVNHRFLDTSFRLPDELKSLEARCREAVIARLARGKVDCTLRITRLAAADSGGEVVAEKLAALRALADRVSAEFPDAGPLTLSEILRWPGVLQEARESAESLAEPLTATLNEALQGLQDARRREGERTAALLTQRTDAIDALVNAIRPRLPDLEQSYRAKLHERLQKLDIAANPERLEQELVLIAQRLDISEEVDRLTGHVAEVRDVLQRDEPVGRRLDFLIQELNREANTLASKSQDEELTRAAVDIKVLIEQMREQVQNLE